MKIKNGLRDHEKNELIMATLAETNMSPENRPSRKGDSYWKPSIFRGENVSFREGTHLTSLNSNPKDHWTLKTGYFEDLFPPLRHTGSGHPSIGGS